MGTTRVVRTYANTEFTSTSDPNPKVLERELGDLALTEQPSDVHRSGTDVVVVWNDLLPLAADIVLIDAAVAAHTGGNTTSDPVRAESEDVSSNATDTWETKLELTTQKLVAGTYEIVWYAEIACDAVVASSTAAVRVMIGGNVEFADKTPGTDWYAVSGNNFVDVLDGDTITTEIRYRKAGTAANMAYIQKTRISVRPLKS
jgi:hypothetical protein